MPLLRSKPPLIRAASHALAGAVLGKSLPFIRQWGIKMKQGEITALPCDIVQEYVVPPDVTAVRIEAESGGAGGHSSTRVTLQVRPGATLRLHLACVPQESSKAAPQLPPD
jgi:hypothetical protein